MKEICCVPGESGYELEAVISFDERGQLILPKDVRAKFGLEAGEKFALISCSENGRLCCFHIIKTNMLNQTISNLVSINKMTKSK